MINNNNNSTGKTVVCITGATGVMGFRTLEEFLKYPDDFSLRLLVRDSKKNRKKLAPFLGRRDVEVVWGDLQNPADVEKAIGEAEYVLHIGGMVSPMADHYPEKTLRVNTEAARNVVNAIKKRKDKDEVKLVYIGSVAQTSQRMPPHHWGRTGDPIIAAIYDSYALSKIRAELIVAESGLRRWVSLRQSGILHKGLIFKGSDPISFHVPLKGVLEWATVEDSARLMVGVCGKSVPEDFWNKFYNIGSGKEFRLTNYEFEKLLLEALGCPPPEKCFEAGWFATRNFHGMWYEDSDKLEEMIPFREKISAPDYFKRMASELPSWMKLTPFVPAALIKLSMKMIARWNTLGTLHWLAGSDQENRIKAFFGSRERQAEIPDWSRLDLSRPSEVPVTLDHGYDESKALEDLTPDEIRKAAEFRGGKCLTENLEAGDNDRLLEWECASGHRFRMKLNTVLKGGHWCPECFPKPWRYDAEARKNPFLAQVWYDSFSPEEDNVY